MDDILSEAQKKWAAIVAKAWINEEFKKKLLTSPKAVLKEHGIPVTPGMTYIIHENKDHATHLVLPSPPSDKTEAEILSLLGSGTL